MKKAAIFDMDGTLVANSPVHIRAFEIFCARYGVTDWREKLANGFGMGNDDIMRLVMPEEVMREKGLAALTDEDSVNTVNRVLDALREKLDVVLR